MFSGQTSLAARNWVCFYNHWNMTGITVFSSFSDQLYISTVQTQVATGNDACFYNHIIMTGITALASLSKI